MSEHLTIERISALLDEPWADTVAGSHLESCDACRLEFERLSRMRMAFSAMGPLDPPADQLAKIEASLDEALGTSREGAVPLRWNGSVVRHLMRSGPLQAAAAVALFAGGIFAGLQFTGGTGGRSTGDATIPTVIPASGDERAAYNTLSELEAARTPLRQAGLDVSGGQRADDFDPYAAAQLVARLDGQIRAFQERLNQAPDDPFASGYLMNLIDQRARIAEAIERSASDSETVEW